MQNERLIVKYSGRKFYDTVEGRIVTLSGILKLVQKREPVRVFSRGRNCDVTMKTLLRAMELYPPKNMTATKLCNLIRTVS